MNRFGERLGHVPCLQYASAPFSTLLPSLLLLLLCFLTAEQKETDTRSQANCQRNPNGKALKISVLYLNSIVYFDWLSYQTEAEFGILRNTNLHVQFKIVAFTYFQSHFNKIWKTFKHNEFVRIVFVEKISSKKCDFPVETKKIRKTRTKTNFLKFRWMCFFLWSWQWPVV